jgi:hypothetical protein
LEKNRSHIRYSRNLTGNTSVLIVLMLSAIGFLEYLI